MAANPFRGRWRITRMDRWDQDFVDLVEPGFIAFDRDGGELAFGAVTGELDWKVGTRDGAPIVEWTWAGRDEGDDVNGRGWARVVGEDELVGHVFFHMSDDSAFAATRAPVAAARKRRRAR